MVHSVKDYLNVVITFSIAYVVALACSIGGPEYNGFPIILICMLISFFMHWIAFIPSFFLKTEKYYDISGTLAYVCVIVTALFLTKSESGGTLNVRSAVTIVLVLIWAIRLGVFLFFRVIKAGEDRRFREVKQKFAKFLVWWSMSALWVFLTTVNALVMIINNVAYYNDYYFLIGLLIWLGGFVFEVVADEQKRRFRLLDSNKSKFISTGLWSISRHPNYFGEILLWIGMAVIAFPTLNGWQNISLISPIFIYFLLTRLSGVNLLESYADEKWGSDEKYQEYKQSTPVLVPFYKNANP
mgnify:FL=1